MKDKEIEKAKTCGILFPSRHNDFKDESGCLKGIAHNDAHIYLAKDGKYYEWEDDYSCKCGCWDDDDDDVCMVYNVVDKSSILNIKEEIK